MRDTDKAGAVRAPLTVHSDGMQHRREHNEEKNNSFVKFEFHHIDFYILAFSVWMQQQAEASEG